MNRRELMEINYTPIYPIGSTPHHDSDYMSLQVAERNAKTLFAVDKLCWALAIVGLAALTAAWWPL